MRIAMRMSRRRKICLIISLMLELMEVVVELVVVFRKN